MTSKEIIEILENKIYTLRTHLNGKPLGEEYKKEKWLQKEILKFIEEVNNLKERITNESTNS